MAAGKVVSLALNQAPRLAVNIAGKLKGLLGPKMYSKMGGLRGLQQVGQEALYSGGASAGFTAAGQLMSGEGLDIPEILAYGLADTVTGGLATGGVRALRGTKGLKKGVVRDKTGKTKEVITTPKELIRSRGEVPANVAASVITPMGVASVLGEKQQPQQSTQTEQVDQQQIQRMLLNEGLLAGQYMPGTMFQGMGVQPPQTLMQQYLNDQGPQIGMDPRAMASIVGL
jgi:hypothetical protein